MAGERSRVGGAAADDQSDRANGSRFAMVAGGGAADARALALSKGSGCTATAHGGNAGVDLGIRTRASETYGLVLYQSELGQRRFQLRVVDHAVARPDARLETQNARTQWPAAETRSTRASRDSAERHSARTKLHEWTESVERLIDRTGFQVAEGRGLEPQQLIAGAPLSRRAAGPARVGLPSGAEGGADHPDRFALHSPFSFAPTRPSSRWRRACSSSTREAYPAAR